MLLKAHAKINWSLDVTGVREDGYHLLDMVMQSVELHDTITITPSDNLILWVEGNESLAAEADNLVLKAARKLREVTGCSLGAEIVLKKNIPSGAGLGGGSADAAAVLKALNEMWGLGLSLEQLEELALPLGADIPFCLEGGIRRAQGIGEKLTPAACAKCYELILLQPSAPLSTAMVFKTLDKTVHPDTEGVMNALKAGDMAAFVRCTANSLTLPAKVIVPDVERAEQELKANGAAAAFMTGSGSVVVGVFENAAEADLAADRLMTGWPVCIRTRTIL